MKKFTLALFFIFLSTTLYSCFKNPITGRSSLNLVDDATMRQMASQEYASFLSESRPVTGTKDAEMVQRLGSRMAQAVEQYLRSIGQIELVDDFNWEFRLVANNDANAWCMPGGKVAVYTGILALARNEAGLATVVGHEIAHAVARHANERTSQQLATQMGGEALGAVLGNNPTIAKQIFATAVGLGAQGALLKFSRDQESEADHMGLIFMALAGYNPQEALNFWSRMANHSGSNPPEILSTHPSDQTRIRNLQKWIPEAMKYYKPQ